MGLMDRFQDGMANAQKAAEEAQKMMGSGMPMSTGDTATQAEYRDRVMKLNSSGVEHPAAISSIEATGNADVGGAGTEYLFGVDVAPAGAEPYSASFTQSMVPSVMEQLSVGKAITVRVDPDDRNSMMFWGMPA